MMPSTPIDRKRCKISRSRSAVRARMATRQSAPRAKSSASMRSAHEVKTWLSRSGTSTPTSGPERVAAVPTSRPSRRAVSITERLVASLTPDRPLSTRETVASLTPAALAMSMSRAITLTLPGHERHRAVSESCPASSC